MRKSIDGLMTIIRDTYNMDPFANALYLFCGRKSDRLKALHFDSTGFVILYKRLDSGRFQWPRTPSEVRSLTRQQYHWLLEGLSIEQPHAFKGTGGKRISERRFCAKRRNFIFFQKPEAFFIHI